MSTPWEIGGDFHWSNEFPTPLLPWPQDVCWFARGRDALVALGVGEASGRLFVPDFFCHEVTQSWRDAGINVAYYGDAPLQAAPDFSSGSPDANDWVMVVNYFGVCDRREWATRLSDEYGCRVIEDHTHDPFSEWSSQSTADFCFASLRKIAPVTDGAILWSPEAAGKASDLKEGAVYDDVGAVSAMALKAAYLHATGPDAELKATFRAEQLSAHERIEALPAPVGVSAWSRAQLAGGYPALWRSRRAANGERLIGSLPADLSERLLFADWESGQCPFAVVLVFEGADHRDACRAALIAKDIYPPIHWTVPETVGAEAASLGDRVLSIPIDQRYVPADMERVAAIMTEVLGGLA